MNNNTKNLVIVASMVWFCFAYLVALPYFNVSMFSVGSYSFAQADISEFTNGKSGEKVSPKHTHIAENREMGEEDGATTLPEDAALESVFAIDSLAPDTSSQAKKPFTILLIGDSMAGCLWYPFKHYCENSKYKLYSFAWYGSTSTAFAKEDTLENWISRYQPDLVMITLGANEILYPKIRIKEKYFKQVLEKLDTLPYIFVGTPNWKPANDYYDMMSQLVPPGQLFVSKDLKLERRKDGAHPSVKGSYTWADSVRTWVSTKSRYRLQISSSTTPAKVDKRYRAYYLGKNINNKFVNPQGTTGKKEPDAADTGDVAPKQPAVPATRPDSAKRM